MKRTAPGRTDPLGLLRTYSLLWRQGWTLAPILVLLLAAATTIARNTLWKDDVTLWEDSAQKSPSQSRSFSNVGFALIQIKRYDEAAAEYRKALEKNPDNHYARTGLGIALFHLTRYDEAISEFRKAIGKNDAPLYRENLAFALKEKRPTREAVAEVSALIKQFPNHISLRASLLTLLHKIGVGEDYLSPLVRKGRTSEDPYDLFDAGWACMALERNHEAEGYLRKTLASLPNFPAARYFLGIVLGRLGENNEAIREMAGAMKDPLISRDAESHYNLGLSYQTVKNFSGAEREYLLSLEKEPEQCLTHNALGTVYLSTGRRAEALAEFQAAVRADPTNPEARKNLMLLTGPTLTTPLH